MNVCIETLESLKIVDIALHVMTIEKILVFIM
jgi:hypothetical protein